MARVGRKSILRARSSKTPVQWIVSDAANNVGPAPGVGALENNLQQLIMVDNTEENVAGNILVQRSTVMRIRGQLYPAFRIITLAAEEFDLTVSAGIIVAPASEATSMTFDPSSADDADASWLWRRTWVFTGRNSTVAQAIPPVAWIVPDYASSLVDVKSKRVLKPNDRLIMFFNKQTSVGTVANYGCTMFPNLRVLMGRASP